MYLFLFSILDTIILVHGSCDHFDIHCTYLLYICLCMFLSPTLTCVISFSLFMHMLLISCMQSIISVILKQAPKAWYDRLTHYLLDRGFKRGYADRTLFVKNDRDYLLVAQVYVDDRVFGATIDARDIEFSEEMKKEFEMNMVGELTFFLGLQVKQKKEGIFISQEKYARNIVKKFGLDSKKHASTPMSVYKVEC